MLDKEKWENIENKALIGVEITKLKKSTSYRVLDISRLGSIFFVGLNTGILLIFGLYVLATIQAVILYNIRRLGLRLQEHESSYEYFLLWLVSASVIMYISFYWYALTMVFIIVITQYLQPVLRDIKFLQDLRQEKDLQIAVSMK